ncbi:MAG: hypothetical protein R2697_06140 [Ilumatobacteraceae bacterium]
MQLDSSLGDIRGVFVAQSIKPQAKVLAESRGFTWVEVRLRPAPGPRPRRPPPVLTERGRIRFVGPDETHPTPSAVRVWWQDACYVRRHVTSRTWSRGASQGRAGHHREHRRPRPRAG